MTNVRAKFLIIAAASEDKKTSVYHVKQFRILNEREIYVFPPDKRSIGNHQELAKNTIIKSALKSIKLRGQFRNITITLSDDLQAIYLDSEGNPCFEGEYLEELPDLATPDLQQPHHIEQPSREQLPEWKPLKSVTNDIVLGKFNGKNFNASTWLTTLETECARLEIPEERYCEVIRLFIERPVTDWYTANRVLLGTTIWGTWRQSFLDSFSNKGWSNAQRTPSFLEGCKVSNLYIWHQKFARKHDFLVILEMAERLNIDLRPLLHRASSNALMLWRSRRSLAVFAGYSSFDFHDLVIIQEALEHLRFILDYFDLSGIYLSN
ncbi:hypothetical protein GE061_017257 [Apolygus lucorum]|uniref:Uncharacterized protein n=1 Tax=Apolygus lucorum TaxID=248454 RepID=A0A8S9XAI1_APOLU|nr:hypothetical protein GE061_017257 [Apolygus lucorum]